ncbi:MAG: SLBB domain-containing protein [Candidatus Kapabacteria bacterium]|nr:SLBB domain-containing protein [Candidatus Kapabacteria bacterium]
MLSNRPQLPTWFVVGCVVALWFGVAAYVHAQPSTGEEPRGIGTTGQSTPYDTSLTRELSQRSLESSVLLERPIDPALYQLGPNDQLTIMLTVSKPIQYEVVVAPDGKLIIPGVGAIDVRNRSLAESETLIQQAVARVYRDPLVAVSLRRMRQFKVSVIGAVRRTGMVVATPATRVSEIIDLAGGASTRASKRNVEIIRNGNIIPVDLMPFYAYGDLPSNPTVRGGDVVKVGVQDQHNIIIISGGVQRPGEFTWNKGDSVSTLIRYAFGFTVDARQDSIEVVKVDEVGNIRERLFLNATPDGQIVGDLPLEIGDQVFVRQKKNYFVPSRVVVWGEVKYPGYYSIEPHSTRLREVIQRAGGFTREASLADAVLIRRRLIEQDPEYGRIAQIDPDQRTPQETEYFRVKNRELQRPGILTVDFNKLMNNDESENLALQHDDSIFVPLVRGFVKVSGKVKNPGNISYTPNYKFRDYIQLAGGYGWNADEGEEKVIKGRTGETFLADNEEDYTIESGDAIFIPEKTEGEFWKGFATAVTIVAQVATIIAVVVGLLNSNNNSN